VFLLVSTFLISCSLSDESEIDLSDKQGGEELQASFPSGTKIIQNKDIDTPLPIAPIEGCFITDYAQSFTWHRRNMINDSFPLKYQIQVLAVPNFNSTVIDDIHLAPGQNNTRIEEDEFDPEWIYIMESFKDWKELLYVPKVILEPGFWYWRVRSSDQNNSLWSDAESFTIKNDDSQSVQDRMLSPSKPIFSFDMYQSDDGAWGDGSQ
jgi:hypothetical protein